MTRPSLRIEIRDKRLAGGRLSLSARTTNKVERRRREAAVRTLIDQRRFDVVEQLRQRVIRIEDVQRAVEAGDSEALKVAAVVDLTLGPAVEALVKRIEATRRERTVEAYRVRSRPMLEWFGADRSMATVSTADAEAFLHAPRGPKHRPWSPNFQRAIKNVGHKLWAGVIQAEAERAFQTGTKPRVVLNPWKKAETPIADQTRAVFLLPAEWQALETRLQGMPQLGLLAVGALAGLRAHEAIHLRTDVDVDLEKRVIRVQPRGGAYPWTPKTRLRSRREIPMSERLFAILHAHRENGYSGHRYFFRLAGHDRPMHYHSLQIMTRTSFEAVGIRYGSARDCLTYHSLRHTFASWLAQRNVNVLVIAKLVGDSVDVVVETYAHLLRSNLEEAIAEIDAAVGG